MTISVPNVYDVQFVDEELECVTRMKELLDGLIQMMNKYECESLECGEIDCPETISLTSIKEMRSLLERCLSEEDYRMY